jgi:hypothetical protein
MHGEQIRMASSLVALFGCAVSIEQVDDRANCKKFLFLINNYNFDLLPWFTYRHRSGEMRIRRGIRNRGLLQHWQPTGEHKKKNPLVLITIRSVRRAAERIS